ncbi:DsbA family protein [Bryobacter aggregatus]|uniref:DsbA family protein n=1 Tax=Bryobacter aggregatus TaxID=360054 RepID=UPI0004E181BA|nr:DsbA family protein [Bryobacter aggregatus]
MPLIEAVTAQDHTQGADDAPVTLIEYGDFECPHCGAAYPVVKLLQKQFGGMLRFVFRNFPLTQIHPHAETAAETAEFAATVGKYWKIHDAIFENQSRLSLDLLLSLASKYEINTDALSEALQDGSFRARVKHDFMSGVHSGVNGTPTFFINGSRYTGPISFEGLSEAIEAASQAGRP